MNDGVVYAFLNARCEPRMVYAGFRDASLPLGTVRTIELGDGTVIIDTLDGDSTEVKLAKLRVFDIPVHNPVIKAWLDNYGSDTPVRVQRYGYEYFLGTIYTFDFSVSPIEAHVELDTGVSAFDLDDLLLFNSEKPKSEKPKTLIVEADDSETTEEVLLGMAYRYGAEQLVHVVNGVLNYSALRPDGMGDWLLSNANGQLLARSERLPHLLAQVIREWSNEASLF